MPKKTLPAWQQVLLTALNNVPKAEDGHDAWQKLNENEQAAVMGFLGEHCGHDPEQAQAMLDETAGMVKARSEKWIITLGVLLAVVVASLALITILEQYFESATRALHVFAWLVFSVSALINAKRDRMVRLWSEHKIARNPPVRHSKACIRLKPAPPGLRSGSGGYSPACYCLCFGR